MDIRRVKFEWRERTLFIVKFNHVIIFHNGDAMKPICELHLTQKAESNFQISLKLTKRGCEVLAMLQNIPGDYQPQEKPYSLHTISDGETPMGLYRDFICVRDRGRGMTVQLITNSVSISLKGAGFYHHCAHLEATDLVLSFTRDEQGTLLPQQDGCFRYTGRSVCRVGDFC